jgi:hypothetical protein
LATGDRLELRDLYRKVVSLTIPAGPRYTLTVDTGETIPLDFLSDGVDTAVYNQDESSFHLTWRTVFRWEDRLADSTRITVDGPWENP